MRIFNKEKTAELFNVDLSSGRLVPSKLLIAHHDYVPVKYHREAYINEDGYPDCRIVIDSPSRNAYDEYEDIQVYVPYTSAEIKSRRIAELKSLLTCSDYKAIKRSEGELTEEEYEPTKLQRRAWRAEINLLGG